MGLEEEVLVVERKVLEQLGMFQGFRFDVKSYLEKLFAPGIPRFIFRSLAEKDPAYKQIIPYVIMTHEGKYLSYVRGKRAGESRLVGNRSIGIGGHINPVDDMLLLNKDYGEDFRQTYLAAVKREVAEEVRLESTYTDRILGLLNDDSTEVGQVHLGIVHIWELSSAKVSKNESVITQMTFMSASELEAERDSLETWSRLCLDNLSNLSAEITGSR